MGWLVWFFQSTDDADYSSLDLYVFRIVVHGFHLAVGWQQADTAALPVDLLQGNLLLCLQPHRRRFTVVHRIGGLHDDDIAVVDESAFAARWSGEPGRVADRRAAWRQVCDEAQVPSVFVDLAAPDLAAADVALDLVLGGQAQ